MKYSKIIPIFFVLCFLINNTSAQVILQQNFNDTTFFSSWKVSENIEHAYALGVNQTKYIRFHPKFQNEYISTPNISISATNIYALIFDWNEAENNNADSVQIQLTKNDGANWQTIRSLKNGNTRIWMRDSVFLGTFNQNENIKIRWRYYSSKDFPSQYFNLDNVQVKVANTVTAIRENINQFEVKIFPNPATNIFTIECKNLEGKNLQLKMYALNGTVLKNMTLPISKKNKIEIDVSDVSKGIYFIAIESQDEIYTEPLIIQ